MADYFRLVGLARKKNGDAVQFSVVTRERDSETSTPQDNALKLMMACPKRLTFVCLIDVEEATEAEYEAIGEEAG